MEKYTATYLHAQTTTNRNSGSEETSWHVKRNENCFLRISSNNKLAAGWDSSGRRRELGLTYPKVVS